MSTPAVVVPPFIAVRDVAKHMDYSGVGCVVVSDGQGVIGVVTDRDLALRVLARGSDGDTPVSRAMTTDPVTVRPDEDLDIAFDVLRRHPFRRLPVVDGGVVIGMVTVDDLLLRVHQVTTDLLRPVASAINEPQHPAGHLE
ncbi:CBS domain-containing protein [Streptosporangium fragile]|uniref:CBS domain-containing protein n=2 Tax=Streptosporangium fragile TaxID=46186 RepID=A0ABP6IEY7_9ACTN